MATNPGSETTAQRIDREEREARMVAAEGALGRFGDTLVCSPDMGMDEEIEAWLQSVADRREEVLVHVGRAQLLGVPTDWCDDLTSRMATFEGRDNAAQSVEGLAIETQYRADRVQRDEAEARQAREAEDEARRAHDAGGGPSRSEEGRRDHEETEGESESESLGGVAMPTTSTRVRARQVSGTLMRTSSAANSSQPAQEPVVELPSAPSRARSEAKRKATESPPQSRPKKTKGGTKGKGKAVEGAMWTASELKARGEREAEGLFDPGNKHTCDRCAKVSKPCNGIPGYRCGTCLGGHRECSLVKKKRARGGSRSDGGRKQVVERGRAEVSDRGEGPSTRRTSRLGTRAPTRQGRMERMSRRERREERMRLLEERMARVERTMQGYRGELEDMRMQMALLRGERDDEDESEDEGSE
ncbi:hypothetical protein BD410DRAFT_845357 [Rickenella mellea]|uniref:Zn(2)-C6 fungal-type domain-containing protein n=1 Tax=Rickenella mellea TaxID=50990 RepID=A0A4Y7PIL6_9AGAM|nr:hypothetical protein BD410DRAFT_845357 [Rickenella mellea]